MYRISALFEEDLEMQDELENLDGLTDDTDDIIIATIDERYPLECKSHLFENEVPIVNEEGFTEDEETAINIAILNDECDLELEHDDDEFFNEALSEKWKKRLKIGAAVAGTGAALYAAHKTGLDQKAFDAIRKLGGKQQPSKPQYTEKDRDMLELINLLNGIYDNTDKYLKS